MLKCWGYATWEWFGCWGWFDGCKWKSSHGGNIICWEYCCIEGVAGINSNCCPGSIEICNGRWLFNSCFSEGDQKPTKIFWGNILCGNLITANQNCKNQTIQKSRWKYMSKCDRGYSLNLPNIYNEPPIIIKEPKKLLMMKLLI